MLDMEIRHTKRPVEFRASDKTDSDPGVLEGYAAVFNRYSQNLGGFVEQVDPGAFTKSLADGVSVVARYNHSDSGLLGTTEAGTLTIEADDTGLRYRVDLPPTTVGRDVSVLARRGDIRYSSFAFQTMEDEWSVTEQGFPLRTLLSVRLIDVAPVNDPAYRDTSVGMRSLATKLNVDESVVRTASTEDLRAMIRGEISPEVRGDEDQHEDADGQGDTHPQASRLALRLKMLELLKLQ